MVYADIACAAVKDKWVIVSLVMQMAPVDGMAVVLVAFLAQMRMKMAYAE